MSKRKDTLKELFGAPAPDSSVSDPGSPREGQGPSAAESDGQGMGAARSGSGAVRAMGLQLGALKSGAEEARALRTSLARGEQVVEIDPARIDPAFLADRLSLGAKGDESFASLKAAIARDGQQVPVLLRPHPEPTEAAAGRYQSAYGHRRILAARELGIAVKAVVRPLTDEALLLAQGQENSERRDLSFIERALFAKAMVARGFDRTLAQAALGIEKTEISRLLQIADAVPDFVCRAIGPAPKAGRGRWMALAGHLESESGQERARALILTDAFGDQGSDERFAALIRLFNTRGATARAKAPVVESVRDADGEEIATVADRPRGGAAITLSDGSFARFIAARMPELHALFLADQTPEREQDD